MELNSAFLSLQMQRPPLALSIIQKESIQPIYFCWHSSLTTVFCVAVATLVPVLITFCFAPARAVTAGAALLVDAVPVDFGAVAITLWREPARAATVGVDADATFADDAVAVFTARAARAVLVVWAGADALDCVD